MTRNDKIFAKGKGKGRKVKSHGVIIICGNCINAAYVIGVIWGRFAWFVAIDKGLYPKHIDMLTDLYLILRLRIIGQCSLSLQQRYSSLRSNTLKGEYHLSYF